MSKHVETTHPQKVMGLYVSLKKALDALGAAGEDVRFDSYRTQLNGLTASVVQDDCSGDWTIVQA